MKGESLSTGAFARWYLDLFIDAAMHVSIYLANDSTYIYSFTLGQGSCFYHVARQDASLTPHGHGKPFRDMESRPKLCVAFAISEAPLRLTLSNIITKRNYKLELTGLRCSFKRLRSARRQVTRRDDLRNAPLIVFVDTLFIPLLPSYGRIGVVPQYFDNVKPGSINTTALWF